MLAVPPALLDLLSLRIGAKVDIGVEDGRLVAEPKTRPPSDSLNELLAQCEETDVLRPRIAPGSMPNRSATSTFS